MADFEELEPLFDYKSSQPSNFVSLEDYKIDEASALPSKRMKVSKSKVNKVDKNEKTVHMLDESGDEEEENENEDWLPSPPKVSSSDKVLVESSIIRELRLKKQELVSFANSAEEALLAIENSAKEGIGKSLQFSLDEAVSVKPEKERPKIVVSIQDKDGLKQFRIYSDDKFERLFKLYTEKAKLQMQSLVFCFDGEKVGPKATPDSLGMEDNDIIEVHVKSS